MNIELLFAECWRIGGPRRRCGRESYLRAVAFFFTAWERERERDGSVVGSRRCWVDVAWLEREKKRFGRVGSVSKRKSEDEIDAVVYLGNWLAFVSHSG